MKSLRPAQVCVIDDEPAEYEKIIGILNRLGLGCVHVAGDRAEDLPPDPIAGVRLVFLDLHLGESEFGKTDYSKTANVFSRVVPLEAAPVLVAVWSKYPEEVEAFRTALFGSKPDYRGRLIFLQLLKKPVDGSGGEVAEIKTAVEKLLTDSFPLNILWAWESLAQDSATNTSAELCRLAVKRASPIAGDDQDKERTKMLAALRGILTALLKAEADKTLSSEGAASDLLRVLSTLQADRLEHGSDLNKLEAAKKLTEPGGTDLDALGKAALNSMLLVGPATTDGSIFRPGSLFEIVDRDAFEKATSTSLLALEKLLFHKRVAKLNCLSFWRWKRKCHPFLLEISPTCDFAQQKRPVARLVGGLLVPEDKTGSAKQDQSGAVRALRPVSIPSDGRLVQPILCAGFTTSLRVESHPTFIRPIARIKEPLLSDIRAWVSSESARIGYTYLG